MSARGRQTPFARLGAAEVTILTASTILGAGFFALPWEQASAAGGGLLFAVLLEAACGAAAVAAAAALAMRFPGRGFTDIARALVGDGAGRALALLVAALDLAVAAAVTISVATVMSAVFLPLTPTWAVEVAFLLVVAYGAGVGIEALGRGLDILMPVVWLLMFADYAMIPGEVRMPWALVPHVPAVGGAGAIVAGAYAGIWAFSGITGVPNLAARLAAADESGAPTRIAWGYAIALVVRVSSIVADLLLLGIVGAVWYEWPSVAALRLVRSSTFFIDRTGSLTVVVVLAMVWAFVALRIWNATVNVRDALGLSGQHGTALARRGGLAARLGGAEVSTALVGIVTVASLAGSHHVGQTAVDAVLDAPVLVLALALPVGLWAVQRIRDGAWRRRRGAAPQPART